MRKLPKYRLSINDQDDNQPEGWIRTSFVKNPAIIIKGLALSAVEEKKLYFNDDLKYQIAGPALLPFQTYRNKDGEEFYVEFTKEDVLEVHKKFMKNLNNKEYMFNVEHSDQMAPAYLLESWVVEDPLQDKAYTKFGIEVPENTIFFVTQIEDKDFYNKLVEEDRVGFSIEGKFAMELCMSEVVDNNNENKIEETKMNKMTLPDGEWTIEDKIYVVKDGEIVEIKDVVKEEAMAEEAPVELAIDPAVEPVSETEDVVEDVAEVESDSYNKEEVDAKFEEVFAMLAELKVAIEELSTPKVEEQKLSKHTQIELSVNDRLADFMRFAGKK